MSDGPLTLDVVVLGSGASGLSAAIAAQDAGASVGVFEKGEKVGGTAALSGGMVWMPGNHCMDALGIEDSREDAVAYFESLSFGLSDPRVIEAYVNEGPGVLRQLQETTPVEFYAVENFPDYHPENPGGHPGGRALECPPFAYTELGPWAERVVTGHLMDQHVAMNECPLGNWTISEEEHQRRVREDVRACGLALVGRLLRGCLDRGIEPQTDKRAERLLLQDGRIVGVRFADGTEVRARTGVVLATGGFEWDRDLARSFLRGAIQQPISIPTNTGDGLKMAMNVGAGLANMREAWWHVGTELPDGQGGTVTHILTPWMGWPGCIMVNGAGQRFTNESTNYSSQAAAFHAVDARTQAYVNLPAWTIFDQRHLDTYGFLSSLPGRPAPEGVLRADSVAELAEQIGVPAGALEATVKRWNRNSAAGEDPDFHRGESAHDRWWGDHRRGITPQATMGPIDAPPFYATKTGATTLGTKGGPRTDGNSQVLDTDGEPMPGLYAAGNVMASVSGAGYTGAGGTLGPALVFGTLAGRSVARVPAGVPA
jgi:succinate dehydrogenase/fumarate reductase flavoprotein subunit